MSSLCLLTSMVFDVISAVNLLEDHLYMMSCFSLVTFKIVAFSSSFNSLIIICYHIGLYEFFLLEFVEVLGCISSCLSSNLAGFHLLFIQISFYPFLFLIFCDSHNMYVGLLESKLLYRNLRLCSLFSSFFSSPQAW